MCLGVCILMQEEKNHSFKKINRLKSKKGFQLAFTKGRTFVDGLAVFYLLARDENEFKIGFAVGRKIGCAAVRNRMKRLMREVYRKHQNELKKGCYLIWMGRSRLARADYKTYERVFLRLARRAGLLKEE